MKFIKKSGVSIFNGSRRQRKQEITIGGNQEEGRKELREEEQVGKLPVI